MSQFTNTGNALVRKSNGAFPVPPKQCATILDLLGRTVATRGFTHTIDISRLHKGIYFL